MVDTQKIFNLIQSWGEFQSKLTDALPDPVFQGNKEALKLTCQLHRKYPAKLLQAFPWNRAYMRGLCGDVGVQLPEPVPPPPGGQCPNVSYRAWGRGIEQVNPGTGNYVPLRVQAGAPSLLTNIPAFTGAITKVQYYNDKGIPVSLEQYLSEGKDFTKAAYLYIYHAGTPSPRIITFVNSWGQAIIEFRRSDGLADTCGSLPPVYSDDPPINPPDFTKTVNIYNYNTDGSIRYTIPVTITIPVDINGGFDLDFDIGGNNVHIDLGGLHFGGTLNIGGGNTTNNITNNYGGGGGEIPFDPGDYVEEPPEPVGDEKEVKKPGIEFVLITVDSLPEKGKTILMNSESDNTFFAGYFRWLLAAPGGSYGYEEIPIRKKRQVFRNPGYTNGYRVYSVNGAVLSSQNYTIQP